MAIDPKRDRPRAPRTVSSSDENGRDADQPVAIVTRVAGSIERATALRLAHGGMRVVVCDNEEYAGLAEIESELESAGMPAVTLGADVTREADAKRVVEAAVAAFGRIDILVNGMATDDCDPLPGISSDSLADGIGNGVRSSLLCTRAVVPHIIAAGGGRIVNVVSSTGRYRSAYFRYSGSDSSCIRNAGIDGALLALTRELAFELAPHRIRVNAVAVGWIRTPASERAWRKLSSKDQSFLLEEISLRRLGEPDEAAAVVEFLATDASSYVTGSAIDVNGGWWMS